VKYFGPYVVQEKLGPVDYVISTPDRRKTLRVCHVNLLKVYRERDKEFFSGKSEVVNVDTSINVGVVDGVSDCSSWSTSEVNPDEVFKNLVGEQRTQLESLLSEFSEVFSDKPGRTNLCTHHIELLPNSRPIRCRSYRLNPEKTQHLKKEIEELLKLGIVSESESAWSAPVVLIPKPGGGLRLCTDFRKTNEVTVADPFPMPRIDDLLDRVGKAKFLSKIDMTKGYWQVPLDL